MLIKMHTGMQQYKILFSNNTQAKQPSSKSKKKISAVIKSHISQTCVTESEKQVQS